MIARAAERFSSLMLLALLLVFNASAQSIQPTLEETTTFISNTLNSRGIVSWTTTAVNMAGAKWTTTNTLAQVHADPSTCSFGWTSIKMSSQDKTVETYLVRFQAVSAVDVQSYSRNMPSQSGEWKLERSPETFLVQIKTNAAIRGDRQSYHKDKLKSKTSIPNDHETNIQFADEQTATKVAEAIRRAAGLCGAKQSPL